MRPAAARKRRANLPQSLAGEKLSTESPEQSAPPCSATGLLSEVACSEIVRPEIARYAIRAGQP
jgi:hypothetical protein